MNKLPLLLDRNLLQEGIRQYISIDFQRYAHALIAGPTGSGKSFLSLSLLGKISKYIPESRLYISDFKHADEYRFLDGIHGARYSSYLECVDCLQAFGNEFEARLKGSLDRTPIFLMFDEFNSFLNYLSVRDKKLAEAQKMLFSNMLFLGRGLNVHVICSVQRPDSNFFQFGGREQFGTCVGLGALSPETLKMLFNKCDKEQKNFCGIGAGYCQMDGESRLQAIQVPTIIRMDKLQHAIESAVTRS